MGIVSLLFLSLFSFPFHHLQTNFPLLKTKRFVLDTWQYFWHRAFHLNQFLYKHIHSVHHRLYCPYSFGALYNHLLEGFILDTLGAVIAHWALAMSVRQATLLFGISTSKTFDNHCGLALPFNPLPNLFGPFSLYLCIKKLWS
jgi:sphinganine C4-monooxygenase